MVVIPDVDEAAGRQVDLISQEIQQLHTFIQTQMPGEEIHIIILHVI